MVDVTNGDVIQQLVETAGVQSAEGVPKQLATVISPVIVINPQKFVTSISTGLANSTSATIGTTSAVKDTYLTGAYMSFVKDVANLSTAVSLTATAFDGTSIIILRAATESALAERGDISITFPVPFKLARGTTIALAATNGTAKIAMRGTVFFYEVQTR